MEDSCDRVWMWKYHNQYHGIADKNAHFLILLHNNSECITIHMLLIVSNLGRHINASFKHMYLPHIKLWCMKIKPLTHMEIIPWTTLILLIARDITHIHICLIYA